VASDVLMFRACWPKAGANKPNPSERASAGSLRASLALFVESLNLFSIFTFYLCVEMMGVSDKSGLPQPPHADHLSALPNKFVVGASFLSLCVELTGVRLSSSGSVFDARLGLLSSGRIIRF